jgi:hypothetical protein
VPSLDGLEAGQRKRAGEAEHVLLEGTDVRGERSDLALERGQIGREAVDVGVEPTQRGAERGGAGLQRVDVKLLPEPKGRGAVTRARRLTSSRTIGVPARSRRSEPRVSSTGTLTDGPEAAGGART